MDKGYYLLAVLDDAAQARLCELSAQLTTAGFDYTRYTPYHITLWGGDEISETQLGHIDEVCSVTPSIDIGLGNVGMFGLAVAFLAPMPSSALISLERAIIGKLEDTPDGWIPHVTLRMGEPDYIRQVAPLLSEIFTSFPCRIERVELYKCGSDYANLVQSWRLQIER
jgi:2'-5' RNA ligase